MTLSAHIHGQRPAEIASQSAAEPGIQRVQAGEWAALFASGVEANKRKNALHAAIDGNPSIACQENGGSIDAELTSDDEELLLNTEANTDGEKKNSHGNPNDNGILASIMASFSAREKARVYLPNLRRGLPAEELERVARTLHDCALAGKPKVSLGVMVPELGEIRFDVQIVGKIVFIHAFVDSEEAAAALGAAVSALRDRLEEHRLVLGKLDVTSPGEKDSRQGERAEKRRPTRRDAGNAAHSDSREENEHATA